jgi:hypothetical protein
MKMPEPVAHLTVSAVDDSVYLPKLTARYFPRKDSKPVFTEEQLKQALIDLLEAAAVECEAEDVAPTDSPTGVQECIAAAIRSMKEKL